MPQGKNFQLYFSLSAVATGHVHRLYARFLLRFYMEFRFFIIFYFNLATTREKSAWGSASYVCNKHAHTHARTHTHIHTRTHTMHAVGIDIMLLPLPLLMCSRCWRSSNAYELFVCSARKMRLRKTTLLYKLHICMPYTHAQTHTHTLTSSCKRCVAVFVLVLKCLNIYI